MHAIAVLTGLLIANTAHAGGFADHLAPRSRGALVMPSVCGSEARVRRTGHGPRAMRWLWA